MDWKLLIKSVAFISVASTIICCIATPVLATSDDTFIQYTLGNGFKQAIHRVTYFEHGFLAYEELFAYVYRHFPGFNWISCFYVLLHIISAVVIVYLFALKKKNLFIAVYLVLFFVSFLMKLSFTTVAAHSIIAGLLICLSFNFERDRPSFFKMSLLSCWLTIALLLRIHIAFPLLLIASPLLLTVKDIQLAKRLLMLFATVTVIGSVAFFLHQQYYEQSIPGWKSIRATTTAYYELGNKGYDANKLNNVNDKAKRAAYGVIKNGFIYDDILLNVETLTGMKKATEYDSFLQKWNGETLYWLLTDIKQYLLMLVGGVILFLATKNDRRLKVVVLCSSGIVVLVALYLLVFMRLPERVWLPMCLLLFLILYYLLPPLRFTSMSTKAKCSFILVTSIAFILQAIFIVKTQAANKVEANKFLCATRLVQKHPSTLFLEYQESFPFNSFPAFNLPAQHPISNVLFPFFFNTELRGNLLKQYKIKPVNASIASSKNIVLIGRPDNELLHYLKLAGNENVLFHEIATEDSCISLFKIELKK